MDWTLRGLAYSTLPDLQHDEEADNLSLVVETSCQWEGPGERRKHQAREAVSGGRGGRKAWLWRQGRQAHASQSGSNKTVRG